jgi:hypothetical protein
MTDKSLKRKERILPLPAAVKERWENLQDAVNSASQPFTGKSVLHLSVAYVHYVMGAEEALDRALDEVRKTVPKEIPINGAFILTKDGPAVEVSWWVLV